MNKVLHGDCLEVLKTIEDNTVDSIVTDPPYELGFMGKSWDNTGIANNPVMWAECLRVLKPGGHLLSFGGTRTYHRMASAIEDAGFEVRDMIEWVYGSGFPKSLNIGKAVDKLQGNEKFREKEIEFVKWLKSNLDCYWCSGLGVISDNEEGFGDPSSCLDCGGKGKYTMEDVDEWLGTKAQAFHFFAESDSNRQIPNTETYTILKSRLHLDDRYDDFVKKHSLLLEEIREVQGYEKSIKNWDKKYNKAILNKPKTELASEWEGWGTALKPAHEPICMARKPLAEKTVAENVLKYGTGGINIDESRVDTITEADKNNFHQNRKVVKEYKADETLYELGMKTVSTAENPQGRFPANIIHDNSEEVRECFPETGKGNGKGAYNYAGREYDNKDTSMFNGDKPQAPSNFNDSGNASRFFKSIIYQAKASKSERNKGLDSIVLVDILRVWNENNTTKEEKLIRLMVTGISPQRVIAESGVQLKNANEWNTYLFGKHLMEKYQEDIKSITKTETNSITTSQISNWLTHLLTNEYIADVKSEMENGGNLVANVENSNTLIFTINEAMALALGVKDVVSGTQLKISVKEGSNIHSTVKPITLMEYLIKMVTPTSGTVLDPFAGSGSTLVAAKQNGFNYIGIEMTAEYIPIIEARLSSIEYLQSKENVV